MSSKPLIHVVGSLNIDFTTSTPHLPAGGETLTATSLNINPGGKGANQAVGCGRAAFTSESTQDVTVEMIGAVGKGDVYYETLLKPTLEKSGVGMQYVREVEGGQTGTATIIVEEGTGENRIMVVPGANHRGMNDVAEIVRRSHGREPDVVVVQGEIPRDVACAVVEYYNGRGAIQVVFNPAPVWPEGIPGRTIKGLSALVVNETECLLLTKAMSEEGYHMETVETETDLTEEVLEQLASEFHGLLNIRTVIVTLGSKGVFYSQYRGQRGLFPAIKVDKVVDTTAAGDTFVGCFATELARGIGKGLSEGTFDVEAACRKANKAAAKCVQRSGAMSSIPFGYEMMD